MSKKYINGQLHKQPQFHLKPAYAAVLLAATVQTAQANPLDPSVVSGQASFATVGNTLTVTNTPGTIINWQGFSIGANEITRFAQQSASSAVLNRVVSNNPSSILGTLQSNGRVFLINPNGIVFGAGATVDVAGLVASTLRLSDADFLAGRHRFTEVPGAANISNAGSITARGDGTGGGQVYLIAPDVENTGVITAPNGEILLAAGHFVDLVSTNDPNLIVTITSPAGVVTNVGQLVAESGSLGLYGAVVRNNGVVSADSATLQGGKIIFKATQRVEAGGTISAQGAGGGDIRILADMQSGTVNVTGTLDASAPVSGDGGFIDTSAAHVQITDSSHITTAAANGKTGTWLIDPFDFTIGSAIGDDITGALLGNALNSSNVSIYSFNGTTGVNGDINVEDAVTWSANTLTLSAYNNININANLTGTGITANLALEYGQGGPAFGNFINPSKYVIAPTASITLTAGSNFSTKLGFDGGTTNYYVITDLGAEGSITGTDLQGINGNLSGNYVLGADIDASATGLGAWFTNGGFTPIGTSGTPYTGLFEGLGHTVSNLYINRPAENYVGLFGWLSGKVSNVGLVDANVTGLQYVGGLVGWNGDTISGSFLGGSISNSYVSGGTVSSGNGDVGGLVGYNFFGSIVNSHALGGAVSSGSGNVGGLVGYNYYGNINDSYVSGGTVSGATVSGNNVGGLVGYNFYGNIDNSYVSGGTVTGANAVGGLVGYNQGSVSTSGFVYGGVISNSYVDTGTVVSGQSVVGGLVGYNLRGTIDNSHVDSSTATGNVEVGGLVGYNQGNTGFYGGYVDGIINNSNVNNAVVTAVGGSDSAYAGGLVGNNAGGISNSFVSGGSVDGFGAFVGGLAGWNNGDINGSHVSGGDISGTASYVGGLAGRNVFGKISNSYVDTGTLVTGGDYVGGLVGYDGGEGFITGNTVTGVTVNGNDYVGGLAGERGTFTSSGFFDDNHVANSFVNGGVVSGGQYVGGLAGWNGAPISNSSVTNTDVTGTQYVGGLVGYNDFGSSTAYTYTSFINHSGGYISNSFVSGGTVSSTGTADVGGLVGHNRGFIRDSHVSGGSVTGANAVGGLVGYNDTAGSSSGSSYFSRFGGHISNSFVSGGTVTGTGSNIGGLAGFNLGNIDNSYVSNGSVTANIGSFNVGILVGQNSGTIDRSYSIGGDVFGDSNVGGLVGENLAGGSISNSYASNGSVTGATNVGGLVGLNRGNISNTYVDGGSVSGTSDVGGLVGYNFSAGSISNSYAGNGSVTGDTNVGGLVGLNQANINNTYVNGGSVLGTLDVGGLVGYNLAAGSISNSYASNGSLSGTTNFGGVVGINDGIVGDSIGGGVFWDTTTVGIGLPGIGNDLVGLSYVTGLNTADTMNQTTLSSLGFDFTNTWWMVDGNTRPFLRSEWSNTITNAHQLQLVAMDLSNQYTLANDIDLFPALDNSVSTGMWSDAGFVPIGNIGNEFSGTFDGWDPVNEQNHIISNLKVARPSEYYVGLFGYLGNSDSTGSVINVGLINPVVTGNYYAGGLAGYNHGNISNSYVSGGTVEGFGYYVGGLVGYNTSSIDSSAVVSGTEVTGFRYVGGLVGYNASGSISFGNVFGAQIDNSYVDNGIVTATVSGFIDASAGGLAGYNDGIISNSYVSGGSVTGESHIGGLVGYNDYASASTSGFNLDGGIISDSFVSGGTVSSTSSGDVGGLAGYNRGFIRDSHVENTGVTGQFNLGGLVGYNATGSSSSDGTYGAHINNSYVSGGTVTGTGSAIGGFAGYNNGSIDQSFVSGGSVTGNNSVGGLVGFNNTGNGTPGNFYGGRINNSFVSGDTVSGNVSVGGLAGYNHGSIMNSYMSGGSVTGARNVGGLVGWNRTGTGTSGGSSTGGYINNTYVQNGTVFATDTETASAGGLAGLNTGLIINSYVSGGSVGANAGRVGGLVGRNDTRIRHTYVNGGDVSGTGSVGGLVGYNQGFVNNSYASNGSVTGGSRVGGVVGVNNGVVGDSLGGGTFWDTAIVGVTNGIGLDNSNGSVPTDIGAVPLTTAQTMNSSDISSLVSGFNFSNWWMVDGNTRPFLKSEWTTTIVNAHQLQLIAMDGTTRGANYILANDIDLGPALAAGGMWSSNGFVPVGDGGNAFFGTFDGFDPVNQQNHVISNLTINRSQDYQGLFGQNSGSISNVDLLDPDVAGNSYVGALAGQNNGNIFNSHVSGGTVTGGTSDSYIGGLVGYNQGNISFSYVDNGTVQVASFYGYHVGGLAGYNTGNIDDSHVSGGEVSVDGGNSIGGLVGTNDFGDISNSYVDTTDVDAGTASGVGGLAGGNDNFSSIQNSYFDSGTVNGGSYVGGLAGWDSGEGFVAGNSVTGTTVNGNNYVGGLIGSISNSFTFSSGFYNDNHVANSFVNGGTVSGGFYVGGLVGSNRVPISDSSVTNTDVTGTTYVGGLVGYNHSGSTSTEGFEAGGVITNSFVSGGTVTGTDYYTGGLAGYNQGVIRDSNVNGVDVTGGSSAVGGLAGYNNGDINNSFVSGGTVSAFGYYVGGLVGYNNGNTDFSHVSDVSVDGSYDVGGLVGYNSGDINFSHASDVTVSGGSSVGGLVGYHDGSISNSFVDSGSVTASAVNVGGLVGWFNGPVSNSYYDINRVLINGANQVTPFGLYDDELNIDAANVNNLVGQYRDWLNGKDWISGGQISLNIADYDSLPFVTSYVISDVHGMKDMLAFADNVSYSFSLGDDIDLASVPGLYIPYLAGSFDGAGFTISNLDIDLPNAYLGLFGFVDFSASVSNVGLANASVTGLWSVGALAGENDGSISGSNSVNSTVIATASSTSAGAGGLVGYNFGSIGSSYVSGGSVTASSGYTVGGLVGGNGGSINNSYVSGGTVTGLIGVGGLAGANYYGGTISIAYSTSAVSGEDYVGGLAGSNDSGGIISDTYSTGAVSGGANANNVGGLAGYNGGGISNSYASGTVTSTGTADVGGVVGYNDSYGGAVVSNTFWNTDTAGVANGIGFDSALGGGTNLDANSLDTRLDTAGMMTMANFSGAGWNIADTGGAGATWRIYEGFTAPLLTVFLKPLNIASDPIPDAVYGDTPVLLNPVYTPGSPDLTHVLGNPYGNAIDVGTYDPALGYVPALYSDQQGYDLTFTGAGALTIDPATLTVLANPASKILNTADPLLTYTVQGLKYTDTAAGTFTGALERDPGETVGIYQIDYGTLALTSSNYTWDPVLNFVSASFTILVPTVINEIVDITNEDDERKKLEESLSGETLPTDDGGSTSTLPVCT